MKVIHGGQRKIPELSIRSSDFGGERARYSDLGWAYCKIPNPIVLAQGDGELVGVLDGIEQLGLFRTDPT